MEIEQWPIDKLKPYHRNPRKISDAAIAKVAESLKAFKFRQPIVVDAKGVIIAGHTRWQSAKKLGMKTVPVHVAADMSEQDAKAYRLADNRVADETAWEQDFLSTEMIELYDADYPIDVIGFNADETAFMFGIDLEPPEETAAAESLGRFKLSLEFDTEQQQQAVMTEMQGRGITCKASGGGKA